MVSMTAVKAAIVSFWRRQWIGTPVYDAVPLPPVPVSAPVLVPVKPDVMPSVEWQFRSTILDRLDEYFVCMRRMRSTDPSSYGLFARTGFAISADRYKDPSGNKLALQAAERLSFGGILCGGFGDEEDAMCQPSFVYFNKVRNPSRVQRASGDIYRLTALYDDRRMARHWGARISAAFVCHVALAADGTITTLKELQAGRAEFRRGRDYVGFATQSWRVPSWTTEKPGLVEFLFGMALLTYADVVSDRIIVRAEQGSCVAAFSVALPRAKQFFADRSTDLTATGQRRRIFHSVDQHSRTIGDGRVTTVRQHYRGQRAFGWNGYRIRIVLPANNSVLHFDKASTYTQDIPSTSRRRWVTGAEAGTMLAGALTQ